MTRKPDDSRQNTRHRVSYKWVKLLSAKSEYIGVVANISNTGIQLSGNLDVLAGDRVHIGMQGNTLISGRVKWRKDKVAGIAFDTPADLQVFLAEPSASQNQTQARSPRFKRAVEVAVSTNHASYDARLIDISPSGLCISGVAGLREREAVYLNLGSLGRCKGHVRWTDRDIAGIALDRTLHIARLSEWLAQFPTIA